MCRVGCGYGTRYVFPHTTGDAPPWGCAACGVWENVPARGNQSIVTEVVMVPDISMDISMDIV